MIQALEMPEFLEPMHNPKLRATKRLFFDWALNSSWWGDWSHAETLELAATGWTEGADRLATVAAGVEIPPLKSIRRVRRWADDGDAYNIHRALGGRLDRAWRTTARTHAVGGRPVVEVSFAMGVNAGADSERAFAAAAAGCVAAMALEQAGYSAGISAVDGCEGGKYCCLRIKHPSEALSLPHLALTCNLAFVRGPSIAQLYEMLGGRSMGATRHEAPEWCDVWIPDAETVAKAQDVAIAALTDYRPKGVTAP